jgi:hypothetical protein
MTRQPSPPDAAPPSARFSASYAEARQRLLQSAAQRGLHVETHTHPLPGAEGETLAMDVVRDGPAAATRVLLTTSAVHGVEGHCGSAVQTALLGLQPALMGAAQGSLAIVHVHAVNPHGFSFGRRVNEDNVDLNRNFIDFSQPLPDNADYRVLHPLLLPDTWPPSDDGEAALAAQRHTWGPRRSQLAVSGGQHSHPAGLFYGGAAPTWSNRVFRSVLRQHTQHAEQLAWIDLHTGLGPYGVGERIFACDDVGGALQRARQWWGEGITSVHTGTSTSIPMTGPIQNAVKDECPQLAYTGICLEFGTVPSTAMHAALRADHWLHAQRQSASAPAQMAQARSIKQALRDVFYPDHDDWKQAVWAQAHQAVVQACQGLHGL